MKKLVSELPMVNNNLGVSLQGNLQLLGVYVYPPKSEIQDKSLLIIIKWASSTLVAFSASFSNLDLNTIFLLNDLPISIILALYTFPGPTSPTIINTDDPTLSISQFLFLYNFW